MASSQTSNKQKEVEKNCSDKGPREFSGLGVTWVDGMARKHETIGELAMLPL